MKYTIFKIAEYASEHHKQSKPNVNLRREHEQESSLSLCNARTHVLAEHLLKAHHYSMLLFLLLVFVHCPVQNYFTQALKKVKFLNIYMNSINHFVRDMYSIHQYSYFKGNRIWYVQDTYLKMYKNSKINI